MAVSVRCKGCGRFRAQQLAHTIERRPCPQCGATTVALGVSASTTVQVTSQVSLALRPNDQRQDWERRWQDIQDEAKELLTPITGGMNNDAIQSARQRLGSFYVNAYHLKDDLKIVSPTISVSGVTIETAITNDPDLALLCDLANLIKHRRLTHPPRSGYRPIILGWEGQTSPAGSGWYITLTVEHNGRKLDGLDVVKRSIDAWRRTLSNWQLI